MSHSAFAAFVFTLFLSPVCGESGNTQELQQRWVYLQMNLQVAENVPKASEILRRAAKVGYNGVVLADYKLNILDRVPEHYFKHAAEIKQLWLRTGRETNSS